MRRRRIITLYRFGTERGFFRVALTGKWSNYDLISLESGCRIRISLGHHTFGCLEPLSDVRRYFSFEEAEEVATKVAEELGKNPRLTLPELAELLGVREGKIGSFSEGATHRFRYLKIK